MAHRRFLETDSYRAEREWLRYQGTTQRELFRELRRRFLSRHRSDARWALDAGSGPGRFTLELGRASTRRVALDLSVRMLLSARENFAAAEARSEERPDLVRGDAASAPFAAGTFGCVALLGNSLGFAGATGERLLNDVEALVAPGGTLLIEVAPGSGESSRYLRRLPPSATGRLLESPPRLVVSRILREGFAPAANRRAAGEFRRWAASELGEHYQRLGWTVLEQLSVAPCLGEDPERLEAAAHPSVRWEHLLEVEETVGRAPERWPRAAALLAAVRKPPS